MKVKVKKRVLTERVWHLRKTAEIGIQLTRKGQKYIILSWTVESGFGEIKVRISNHTHVRPRLKL